MKKAIITLTIASILFASCSPKYVNLSNQSKIDTTLTSKNQLKAKEFKKTVRKQQRRDAISYVIITLLIIQITLTLRGTN